MGLISELQRRKVFKVGAAYLVVAWLAVQAASIGFPAFDAPPWVLRVFILVALLGFPLALAMAWVFDVTPGGLRTDAAAPGSKRVFAVVAVLATLALGWFFYGQPAFRRIDLPSPAAAAAAAGAKADADARAAIPRKSIAVLPFADLSPKHDQDYFSDGMAEELLNALVRIKDLKVAGRTSSFHYKGRNEDLRSIGRALGVAHVLEGSVRTQGQRVRITAQLIRTDDDFHVWSQTYDGKLDDIFDLQEKIARKIAQELAVVLEGEQKARLVARATDDPEAYALYLQASSIFNRRQGARYGEGMDMLRQAIARDPEFARAHSRLATMAVLSRLYLNLPDADAIVEKEASAASALDPGLAEPHAARAQALAIRRQFVQAFAEFDRALALDPDDVTARFWHAIGLIQCGYTQRGNAELDRVLATDPLLPNGLYWRGMGYLYAGDRATAQRMLQRSADAGLAFSGLGQSIASHEAGDDEAARRQLAAGLNGGLSMEFTADDIELLVRGVFGAPAERAAAVAWIDRKVATAPKPVNGMYPHLLLRLHEPARALAVSGAGTNNDASLLPMLWSPYGSELRALPQFPAYLRQMHLAQTWDALGPPDLCTRAAAGGWRCR